MAAVLLCTAFGSLAFVGPASEKPQSKSLRSSRTSYSSFKTAEMPTEGESSPFRLGGAVLSILAAVALAVLPMEAQAARSGGRIGGSAPSMRRAPPRPSAPAASSSTTNKTVINKTTVVAPAPVYGGYGGMGYGMGYAAPTVGDVVVGTVVGGAINNAIYGGHNHGYSNTDRMIENQQRQDERQLDNQSREIEQLKSELQQLRSSKN